MMHNKFIMFLACMLLVGNMACLVADGAWLGAEDLNLMQYLTGYSTTETMSWTAVIMVPVAFFTHGLPKLIFWDFSFFSGELAIIRWFLFIVSIGAVWAVAQEFRTTITSLFGRR